jgi:hypothetical protein
MIEINIFEDKIKMSNSDKPKSPNQKYYSEKGRINSNE